MNIVSQWDKEAFLINKDYSGKTIKHCKLLDGSVLAVTPGFLKVCGQATHEKGSPTICEYDRPNIDPKNFLNGLAAIVHGNQGENGPCTGCRFLVETSVKNKIIASKISYISLHDFCGCNANCVYCSGSEYHLPVKNVSTFDYKILFSNLLKNKMIEPYLTVVGWGGGEPTLLDSFEETVTFLRDSKIRQVINTSGIAYSPAVAGAIKEKMASVQVSVDSGTNETYYKVKGNEFCDKVWKNIQQYASHRGDFILKYIILSFNSDVGEVVSFIERAKNAGVKKICISVDVRSVFDHSTNNNPLTIKELKAAASIYDMASRNGMYAFFSNIWHPEHLKEIEMISSFKMSSKNILSDVIRTIKYEGFGSLFGKIKALVS